MLPVVLLKIIYPAFYFMEQLLQLLFLFRQKLPVIVIVQLSSRQIILQSLRLLQRISLLLPALSLIFTYLHKGLQNCVASVILPAKHILVCLYLSFILCLPGLKLVDLCLILLRELVHQGSLEIPFCLLRRILCLLMNHLGRMLCLPALSRKCMRG